MIVGEVGSAAASRIHVRSGALRRNRTALKVQVVINYLTGLTLMILQLAWGCTAGEKRNKKARRRFGAPMVPAHSRPDTLSAIRRRSLRVFGQVSPSAVWPPQPCLLYGSGVIQFQVVTHHRNLLHRFDTGANQRCAFTGLVTLPFSIRCQDVENTISRNVIGAEPCKA